MNLDSPGKQFARQRHLWLEKVQATVARGELPQSAFSVAFELSRHINSKTRIAWPSEARIAKRLGLKEGTVQKRISQLRCAGFLIVRRANKKLTNRYCLACPSKTAADPYSSAAQGRTDPHLETDVTRTEMRINPSIESFYDSPPTTESVPAIETRTGKEREGALERSGNTPTPSEPTSPEAKENIRLGLRSLSKGLGSDMELQTHHRGTEEDGVSARPVSIGKMI
jgi:Helix-turn-helix domain